MKNYLKRKNLNNKPPNNSNNNINDLIENSPPLKTTNKLYIMQSAQNHTLNGNTGQFYMNEIFKHYFNSLQNLKTNYEKINVEETFTEFQAIEEPREIMIESIKKIDENFFKKIMKKGLNVYERAISIAYNSKKNK